MEHDKNRVDESGYPVQRHTLHIMPAIYPDTTLGEKAGAEKIMQDAYTMYKAKYEEVYGEPLVYTVDGEENNESKND
jgi:hypothetical protein